MTNLEKIRQMSDEELAEVFISRFHCPYMNDCKKCGMHSMCVEEEKSWLNSEVEE